MQVVRGAQLWPVIIRGAGLLLLASALTVLIVAPGALAAQAGARPHVEVIAQGLNAPWALAFGPTGQLYLTERPGRIRVVTNGQLQPAPVASLDVATGGEAGLLGLALDPDFQSTRQLYVAHTYHTASGGFVNRLIRLREDSSSGLFKLDQVLLDGIKGAGIHDGGRVRIGADGKLYLSAGDTGDGRLAEQGSSLNGKILRLNLDGTIPSDRQPNTRIPGLLDGPSQSTGAGLATQDRAALRHRAWSQREPRLLSR
jgi:glucose/arabinose dehydrogenase